MSKRVLIVILVGLNLVLLSGVVLTAYSPPAAMAQAVGRGGEYILIAAEAELASDAVYLIDLRLKQMYAFRSTFPRMAGEPTRVALLAQRDLARDFGK